MIDTTKDSIDNFDIVIQMKKKYYLELRSVDGLKARASMVLNAELMRSFSLGIKGKMDM